MKMLKRLLLLVFLLFVAGQAFSQQKSQGKVKRKFQRENQESSNLPKVLVHGRVQNQENEYLPGATVYIPGTRISVNTNDEGEYFLQGLPTGRVSIVVSFVGYRTKIIDYVLQEGNNNVYFTLDRDNITLEAVTVTSQLREQQLPDIPQSVSVVSRNLLDNNAISDMPRLSEFVPGLQIREQTPHRPNFVIRGMTSDEVSLNAQPRISVYYNNVPTSRPSMASAALYDMERVEVLKGPQNTLFGRGAEAGVVHFLSRKPDSEMNGFLSAGGGDFAMKEVKGAINIPVADKVLFVRTAGLYSFREGYVQNTFGGALNGKNTLAGRVSVRFLPFWNTKIDMVINYQKDHLPGTAFMSRDFPNANGMTGIFNNQASLEQGKNLKNNRDVLGASLEMKHFRTENSYFYSNSSYYTNNADSRWDGDGTAAPAIDMAENLHVDQFSQELRYNFSRKSRMNGSVGVNYWQEKAAQTYWFGPDEQYMSYLILQMPQYLVGPDGKSYPMVALPQNPALGPLAGLPLPSEHEEENRSSAGNMAIDLFADATLRLSERLSFTGGIRGIYENFSMTNESVMTGGEPSTLGMLTQMAPNLFFKPVAKTEVSQQWKALTYRTSLKFDVYENSALYAAFAKGRRPPVIQFNSQGESQVMQRELLNSFEAGLKSAVGNRVWIDVSGFFQIFSDFQTNAWVENNYLVKDAGKATSFGAEASFKGELLKNLGLFGNYAFIHARFDEFDSDGNAQEYAGNQFRLTPEHSFTIGMNSGFSISSWIRFFAHPSFSWNSHIWFEDANIPGLEQEAFGTLNATAGFLLPEPNVTLSFSGTNLLDEKFLISAGNTGTMFGVPTFVPGPPRMLEARVIWRF